MNGLVIDASVVVKWFIEEIDSDKARLVLSLYFSLFNIHSNI